MHAFLMGCFCQLSHLQNISSSARKPVKYSVVHIEEFAAIFVYNLRGMKYKGVAIDSISIFSTPAIYLQLTSLLIKDAFIWLKNFILTRGLLLFLITLAYILIANVDALQVLLFLCRPLKIYFTSSSIGSC